MSTRREQILEAVAAALTGVAGNPGVYRSRVLALQKQESPAIVIEPIQDTAEILNIARLGWTFTFQASVIVRSEAPDQDADAIINDVHNKLMGNTALRNLVSDLRPSNTTWQFLEADTTAVVVAMQFSGLYQTSALNLSSL